MPRTVGHSRSTRATRGPHHLASDYHVPKDLPSLWSKSDLRNHQAIVQPRLYDSLMVTQITLKTEGPHGLPSGRQTEVDPLYRGLIILTVYDCGHAFQSLERSEPSARTHRLKSSRARTHRLEGAAGKFISRCLRDYEGPPSW